MNAFCFVHFGLYLRWWLVACLVSSFCLKQWRLVLTESEMLSFWQNFLHLHLQKLSKDNFYCSQWWKFYHKDDIHTHWHCVPDSKVHGTNMGPIWILSDPDGPHVGPMNLAIRGVLHYVFTVSQIARFMGPTWGPSGSCRTQMGPMLAPWTLLSGVYFIMFSSWDLRKSHDYNFCQILGKLIPNSQPYTAITSCRASKL